MIKNNERICFDICCGKWLIANAYLIYLVAFPVLSALIFVSCTSPKYLSRTGIPDRLLSDPAISDTHLGVAVYDADSKEYVYTHNSDKFFVPASNIKLPTLYAGLRYLGDSIPGIQYIDHNDTLFLRATGDPSFLLMDFPEQPVFDFLQHADKPMVFIKPEWKTGALGYGWPWNFYLNYYMPERSPFPAYGNVIIWVQRNMPDLDDAMITYVLSHPGHSWPVEIISGTNEKFEVRRPVTVNNYSVYPGLDGEQELFVPFVTKGMQATLELLRDTLNKDIGMVPAGPGLFRTSLLPDIPGLHDFPDMNDFSDIEEHSHRFVTVHSRPADSLFRPMMLYSDNFFAEQTLIMASNKKLGVMDERRLIDHLLENELKDFPHEPRWVDGSGLSRYNLFTPQSLVWLLEKMKDEFGFERVSHLLPTGGEGTLENLYQEEKGKIYAKTGTLGGNAVTLSGFIITEKDRMLIFSVLVNNHNKDSSEVRKAIEDFIKEIIYRY